MLCAIHAAISATDAVTIALSGVRSTDPNHLAAAGLLRDAGRGSDEFEARARQLVTLIQKKNVVEYDGRNARESEAEDAVKRAERILDWATAIVGKSGGKIA
jgi:hypothetical protein